MLDWECSKRRACVRLGITSSLNGVVGAPKVMVLPLSSLMLLASWTAATLLLSA
jgi:hypothetical protein